MKFNFSEIAIKNLDGSTFEFDVTEFAKRLHLTAPGLAEHLFAENLYNSVQKGTSGEITHSSFDIKTEDVEAIEKHISNMPYAFFIKNAIINYLKQ